MKNNQILAFVIVLMFGSVNVFAGDAGLSGFASLKSKYVISSGAEVSDNPVSQGGLTYQTNTCAWLDLWWSKDTQGDAGDEIDYTVGCTLELNYDLSVTGKVAFFDFGRVGSFGDDLVQTSLEFGYQQWGLSLNHLRPQGGFKKGTRFGLSYKFDEGFAKGLNLSGDIGKEPYSGKTFQVVGAEYVYPIAKSVNLSAKAVSQLKGSQEDTHLILGISYGF